jgi:hypothetical protein
MTLSNSSRELKILPIQVSFGDRSGNKKNNVFAAVANGPSNRSLFTRYAPSRRGPNRRSLFSPISLIGLMLGAKPGLGRFVRNIFRIFRDRFARISGFATFDEK